MEENKKEVSIWVWLGLLAVLFAAVIGIFAMLETVAPENWKENAVTWNALLSKDDGPTAYTTRILAEKEQKSADVVKWLGASGDYIAQELGGDDDDQVFWLYRQDSDEYILYMPEQDRALAAADMTADEEKDEDGAAVFVLRIRTPEESQQVEPKQQLFSFATTSEKWNGIRLKIILDGKEQNVYTLTSKGDELFTTTESYIGRN